MNPAATANYLRTVVARRAVATLLVMSFAFAPPARAQAVPPPEVPDRAALAAAVDRGLVFIARQQRPDGSFTDGDARAAQTALSLLAFLSAGEPPADGRFGRVINRATDFLVSSVPEDGYIGRADGSRMYGHAVVTLALSQVIGVEPDDARRLRIREALRRAVTVLVSAQNVSKEPRFQGGWRYEPDATDADLAVTAYCALALRGAHSAGVDVPQAVFTRAVRFVLACRTATGALAYQPGTGPRPATTAAGAVLLQLLPGGSIDATGIPAPPPPELASALDFILARLGDTPDTFPLHTTYYTLRATRLAGGEAWARASRLLIPQTLRRQLPDGRFAPSPDPNEPGPVFSTALSVLTLTASWRILPAFEP